MKVEIKERNKDEPIELERSHQKKRPGTTGNLIGRRMQHKNRNFMMEQT
jgi:hypothetical protein